MRNYKRIIGTMAIAAMTFALAACGSPADKKDTGSSGGDSSSELQVDVTKENVDYETSTTTAPIVTTTTTTTTTDAESTIDATETTANGGGGNPNSDKRKDYIEQDDRNIYSRCSIFGVLRNDNTTWGDLSLANADNSLQGIVNKFGLKPIEGEGADYEGGLTAFGFKGKGYYTIADDKTSTKVYLMTDENGEVVGVVFTDFNKSSIPVAGNATDIGYGLNPEKHLVLSSIRSDYEQFASEHTRYSYNFVTEDGYENGYSYERYNDEYYSMFFSMNVYGESVDTYAVMDNAVIKESEDLVIKKK